MDSKFASLWVLEVLALHHSPWPKACLDSIGLLVCSSMTFHFAAPFQDNSALEEGVFRKGVFLKGPLSREEILEIQMLESPQIVEKSKESGDPFSEKAPSVMTPSSVPQTKGPRFAEHVSFPPLAVLRSATEMSHSTQSSELWVGPF